MDFILFLHSFVRYLVLIAAVLGLVKTITNLTMKNLSEAADRLLAMAFLGLIDLQALLGILLIFLGGLRGPLHPLLMFVALILAHVLGTSVKRSHPTRIDLLRLALYVVPLAIILLALLIIIPLPV